ncbi:MAG TPA: hypothetical protein PLK12_03370 [Prolixibacteraceae bacterium]|nr:hypothetical protein [Prolixibacteraceae bacterium]
MVKTLLLKTLFNRTDTFYQCRNCHAVYMLDVKRRSYSILGLVAAAVVLGVGYPVLPLTGWFGLLAFALVVLVVLVRRERMIQVENARIVQRKGSEKKELISQDDWAEMKNQNDYIVLTTIES